MVETRPGSAVSDVGERSSPTIFFLSAFLFVMLWIILTTLFFSEYIFRYTGCQEIACKDKDRSVLVISHKITIQENKKKSVFGSYARDYAVAAQLCAYSEYFYKSLVSDIY